MTPVEPRDLRRRPEHVRRQIDVAAAAAWEALVEVHTGHALRFVALMAARLDFDQAVDRYLDELDVRNPMAAAIRARVLVALEHALTDEPERPTLHGYGAGDGGGDGGEEGERGLRRFRPDVLFKGVARRVRETESAEEWVRLAVARAEEGVIRAHIDNAIVFASILGGHATMTNAVDDYLELMRVSGGRGQSVHQRAMARLAEMHLPEGDGPDDGTDADASGQPDAGPTPG